MLVLKTGGTIYGAKLTAQEKKALDLEIKREIARYDDVHIREVDAIILWRLHTLFGFGPAKLRKFYEGFQDDVDALVKRYELDNVDDIWLCTKLLKDYGVDLEAWENELGGKK